MLLAILLCIFLTGALAALVFYCLRLKARLAVVSSSAQSYSLLWQHLPDIITEIDSAGRVLNINRLVEGFSLKDVVGRLSDDMLTPEQRIVFNNSLQAAVRTQETQSYELQLVGRDGQIFWLSCRLVPVVHAGVLQRLMVISTDVTDIYRARDLLNKEKAEAQEESLAKSRFLASMSHEIRTPMTGLIGMISLLEQTSLDEEQREFIGVIQQSSEHLLNIVNDILDSSKIDADMLQIEQDSFSLRRLIDGLVGMMAAAAKDKGLSIQSFIEPRVPDQLVGDAMRIRQILMNYLSNAVKFTDNGHVLLRVVQVSPPGAEVRLRFSVEDSGIGISADHAMGLFSEYSSAHGRRSTLAGGTGLGLSICKRLAHLMGGKVGVISSVGIGSSFWLDLALPVNDIAALPAPDDLQVNGHRLWVADENPVNRALLMSVAREQGFDVTELVDQAALSDLIASGQTADVLVVSERLFRSQMTSLAAMSEQGCRIAVTSLYLIGSDRKQWSAQGVSAFWSWPIGQQDLSKLLKRLTATEKIADGLKDQSRTGAVIVHTETGTGCCVLLAEDNAVNQKVAERLLQKLGCTVVVAGNGREAVKCFAEQDFDVVLMDCHMPVMDGIEATRLIKEHPRGGSTPVIALSADVMPEQKAACDAAGMDGYLTKPVRLEDLRQALSQHVAKCQRTLP